MTEHERLLLDIAAGQAGLVRYIALGEIGILPNRTRLKQQKTGGAAVSGFGALAHCNGCRLFDHALDLADNNRIVAIGFPGRKTRAYQLSIDLSEFVRAARQPRG